MTARWARAVAVATVALGVTLANATPSQAALGPGERLALRAYLVALEHGDYAAAFARLTPDGRRYFRSPRNLAAVFAADRVKLEAFTIVESANVSKTGTIAVVRERVTFFDHAHQRPATLTANVRYGIVSGATGVGVKDPFHPWFAFAPTDLTAMVGGIRVSVRKISFYTGRLEVLATFANTGDATVTILPYGRSIVRDEAGGVHAPIRSNLPGLTDRALFEGLRLPPSGRYTGALTFFTSDRFQPKRLGITIAPALLDGADAPFELKLPEVDVPPRA